MILTDGAAMTSLGFLIIGLLIVCAGIEIVTRGIEGFFYGPNRG